MRGHEDVIKLRQSGLKPRYVFINDYECETGLTGVDTAIVRISTEGDVVQLLDMRFAVGLRVGVTSNCEARTKALAEKCKAAGAVEVAAVHVQPGVPGFKQSGWTEVWRKNG